MKRNEEAAAVAAEEYRPPYLAALVATLAVWALYALTLSPTTWFWDTSEYIATGHIVGIPHPPGNPLFVILARTWDILLAPFGLPTAVRINLFSASMSALAHGCWFLVMHRVMAYFTDSRAFRLIGASLAVLLSATAFTVWNQSNVNEKVYTVSLFTIALLSFLAFRWRDNIGKGKDDNLILLMLFLLALSVGNHLMAFLAAPAIFVFILLVEPRTLGNWRLYATGIIAVVLGLSVHLVLPIRSGLHPVINEAAPTCPSLPSALTSVLTMGRAGCEDLSEALSRTQYDKPSMFVNPNDPSSPRDAGLFSAQMANYFQYFDWQWARAVAGNAQWFGGLRPIFTLMFAALGIWGAFAHYKRDRKSFAYVAILFGTLAFGLTFYLNFRYGYSYPDNAIGLNEREVRERDYFFIVSFSVFGLWIGLGVAALWQWLSEKFLRRHTATGMPAWIASPVLVLAALPLLINWSWANRNYDYTARDWAYNLLNSVEPYGVLFTNGDNDTFPLWYAQEVEGVRRDVTVIVMSYLNTPWYAKQIRDLTTPCGPGQDPNADPTVIVCQRPFNPENSPAVYGDSMAKSPDQFAAAAPGRRPPTRTILPLTDEQIHQIANTYPFQLDQAREFRAGGLTTTLPAGSIMLPSTLFMGHILTNGLGDRPIYFATTTAAYNDLNLRQFIIRQGVAFKLNNGPLAADPARGLIEIPQGDLAAFGGPVIDLPRTEYLLSDVFMHRGNFPEWNHWVDVATQNIPYYYFGTHFTVAQVYGMLGDTTRMQQHAEVAEKFWELSQK